MVHIHGAELCFIAREYCTKYQVKRVLMYCSHVYSKRTRNLGLSLAFLHESSLYGCTECAFLRQVTHTTKSMVLRHLMGPNEKSSVCKVFSMEAKDLNTGYKQRKHQSR